MPVIGQPHLDAETPVKHDLIHFVAYSAIFLALLFWPTHEHATACFAYGALAGFSLSGAITRSEKS